MSEQIKDQLKKAKRLSASERLVRDFDIKWMAVDGQTPLKELRFHKPLPGEKKRQFKFDFAWPKALVAVELEGGVWGRAKSRHTTGSGFHKDCEKYNLATFQGWAVLRLDEKLITIPTLTEIRNFITLRKLLVTEWREGTDGQETFL